MRNGIIADTLRKGGSSFKIIFGLNIPQLVEIARNHGYDTELADALWQNRSTRESMLLAPMLLNPASFDVDQAHAWIDAVPDAEIADNLCHKLLRHLPYAYELAVGLAGSQSDLARYIALRLLWHFLPQHPAEIRAIADKEILRDCRLTLVPARQTIDELDFMEE